jgi:hypothetical protein
MKSLLTVSAVIELGAGAAMMCWPSALSEFLIGVPLEGPGSLTVARVGGAGLLALVVACGWARHDSQSPAARGIVTAMLLYDIAAAVVLAHACIGSGMHGLALWPAVILHTVMAAWCVVRLAAKS